MHYGQVSELVRASGYELLFLLGEAAALAIHPTMRNAEHLERVFALLRERRAVGSLRKRGLLARGDSGSDAALLLTALGETVFDGGRNPEERWNRSWDGQWRLLTFDLPRKAGGVRLRFWRWLRANHFGKLQGSVWIAPDPVPRLEATAKEAGFDPSAVLVFTGTVGESLTPRAVAGAAWDFGTINLNYRRYLDFAESVLGKIRQQPLPLEELPNVLQEDRRQWWRSLRKDPLLPRALLPPGYNGMRAWKTRRKLHKTLFRRLDLPSTP